MAKETTKQKLANLIQCYNQVVQTCRSMYDDEGEIKDWAIAKSNKAQQDIENIKQELKDKFSIDYDSDDAKKKVIKEGSTVEVLVNHMDGMLGSTATVKSYSIPAMLSDMVMKDGMKMTDHKWLTNNEVKLK